MKSISEKVDCLIRELRVSNPQKGNYHRRSSKVNDRMSYSRHREDFVRYTLEQRRISRLP